MSERIEYETWNDEIPYRLGQFLVHFTHYAEGTDLKSDRQEDKYQPKQCNQRIQLVHTV